MSIDQMKNYMLITRKTFEEMMIVIFLCCIEYFKVIEMRALILITNKYNLKNTELDRTNS